MGVVSPHAVGADLRIRPEDLRTDGAKFRENCSQAEIQIWVKHTVDSNTLILTKSGRGMVQALIRKLSTRVW